MTAWNDPPLSWLERFFINCAAFLFVAGIFIGAMWFIGAAGESHGQHRQERDRCLRDAANGYEIERCR